MKFELRYIGRPQQSYIEVGINMYLHRIKNYANFEIIPFPRIKNGHKLSKPELLKKEAELILKGTGVKNDLVLLDENGQSFTSVAFSKWIERQQMASSKKLIFLIGGVYGFSEELKKRSKFQISLSKMTLPHEMARLVFVEQFYRAFTILRNEAYHNP